MIKTISYSLVWYLTILTFLLVFQSCMVTKPQIASEIRTFPTYPIQPAPELVLLINTFDVPGEHLRDSKQELFVLLIDSTLVELSRRIGDRTAIPTRIISGLTKTNIPGQMSALLSEHLASHAIAITGFDVLLRQTDVVTTEDEYGKSKEAFYDIISVINYTLYDTTEPVKDMEIMASRYHSSRSVISGLLAAGPNIVNNKEAALNVMRDNVELYLNYFIPGQAQRYRSIYVDKELSKVNDALQHGDYEAAMKESLLYINDTDKTLAAKANYNCAVFLEHELKQAVAKSYLQKSLQLYILPEAWEMKEDYGL
ncbi:MAG: hypothetical protein IPL92_13345 [Saprospiraceae bacterium]|nr:hypothetical protein [Candidatus Opimibacter iunctus]